MLVRAVERLVAQKARMVRRASVEGGAQHGEQVIAGGLAQHEAREQVARDEAREPLGREATGEHFWPHAGVATERLLQLAAHAPNPDRDTPSGTAYPGRAIAEGSAGQEVGQVERWLNRRAQPV